MVCFKCGNINSLFLCWTTFVIVLTAYMFAGCSFVWANAFNIFNVVSTGNTVAMAEQHVSAWRTTSLLSLCVPSNNLMTFIKSNSVKSANKWVKAGFLNISVIVLRTWVMTATSEITLFVCDASINGNNCTKILNNFLENLKNLNKFFLYFFLYL